MHCISIPRRNSVFSKFKLITDCVIPWVVVVFPRGEFPLAAEPKQQSILLDIPCGESRWLTNVSPGGTRHHILFWSFSSAV